jgi:hypothetical protein
LKIQHESIIHGQDHHWDPTSTLILARGTPTWSSMKGSHVGQGNPSQPSRPSPPWNGVPLFSAPRRRMMNGLMRGSWPRGYKYSEWWLGQRGVTDPGMGWADQSGPISAQSAASFARCWFPSLLDPYPFCMWALVISFSSS